MDLGAVCGESRTHGSEGGRVPRGTDLSHLQKGTLSVHRYRDNKRLTQAAKAADLRTLTWTPWRTYLVSEARPKAGLKPDRAFGAIGAPPTAEAGGSPRLKARIVCMM
jgi:hypothetical protein